MGYCYSKIPIKSKEVKIEIKNKNNNDSYLPWEQKYIDKINQLEEISIELEEKNRIQKSLYYHEISKNIINNNELKIGYLIKAINNNNLNEEIISDYLITLQKISVNDNNINYFEQFQFYERFLSIDLLKKKFPESQKKISSKEDYFNLLIDFINIDDSKVKLFIEKEKIKLTYIENFIPNQPIKYHINKEAFFYFQKECFLNYFNQLNCDDENFFLAKKNFLRKFNDTIIYFKDNLPNDEKEINRILFTFNFCSKNDFILSIHELNLL